jgi:hypothetical protein
VTPLGFLAFWPLGVATVADAGIAAIGDADQDMVPEQTGKGQEDREGAHRPAVQVGTLLDILLYW